ncbi:MAG: heat-inducible transcriptional repressor HrcA [Candidatus Omnitrophica bacterium]|nr:heat-inducible transcriptional repressor HrcA [Candidatus Omnitrophota bacterium]
MSLKDFKERQNKILEIIISSYVNTASPIGSRTVSKKMGLSSATVRNVMADLEEFGYITHPHTSAGRVPTDKGYRRYVESFTRLRSIPKDEARHIEEEYKIRRKSINDLIKKTAEILSAITHQTGVVLFPKGEDSTFKHIELISVGKKKILVVLVTSAGVVENFIADTKEDLAGDAAVITNLLNSECYGLSLTGIKNMLLKRIKQERDSFQLVIEKTSDIIESILNLHRESELYLEGTSYLLAQPEFEGKEIARLIREVFEDKSVLSKLIEQDLGESGIRIHIGKENKFPYMRDCTILTSGYRIKDELVGRLGIIGPTRMEYDHLIPVVNYVSDVVSKILSGLVE